LLANELARQAILRLMQAPGPFELVNLLFRPDALQLRLYRTQTNRVTPQAVQEWLQDLCDVAGVAESIPAPAEPLQASQLEQALRTDGGSVSRKVMLGTVAAFGFLFLCVLLVFAPLLVMAFRGK